MRVSFSPDIIPGGWLGSQPQLTNKLCMCMTLVLCSIIRVPAGSPSRGGGFCDLRTWHKPAEFAYSFLFCPCVYFCISCPFNCIPFHKILPTILCFLTLFFPSYFCLIGPGLSIDFLYPSGRSTPQLKVSTHFPQNTMTYIIHTLFSISCCLHIYISLQKST